MSTIDKAALIEQADNAAAACRGWTTTTDVIATALPVIAKALLAPLREKHSEHQCGISGCPRVGKCEECARDKHPCPTARLIDAIEAEVQP